MKFISAGHCTTKGPNYDPGAVGVNGRTEAAENLKMRNAVLKNLIALGYKDIVTDLDGESLGQYLARIKPGNASVVLEFHFNAFNKVATGTEAIVQMDADTNDYNFAKELAYFTATTMNIALRGGTGVIKENQSQHRRLGLMREQGIVCLLEICFIDNPKDMCAYDLAFDKLAAGYAKLIAKYDDIIK